MDIAGWSDIAIALISAATGGGLLKIVDTWLNRAKLKNETAKQLRDEAKEETVALKTEVNYWKDKVREAEKDIDSWKAQYWKIFTDYKLFQLKVGQILIDNGISAKDLLKDE